MVTESVSPDTKFRFNYAQASPDGERELELGGEYAFTRGFSIEAELPYDLEADAAGTADVSLKFAHYGWEARGLLVGGGLAVGIPLAEDEVTGEVGATELEPFLNAGLMVGPWELVGATHLSFAPDGGDEGTLVGWNASALYHLTARVETMLEYDGVSELRGAPDGTAAQDITPGIKVRPFGASSLMLGGSLLVPIAGPKEFDTRFLFSTFYHF